MNSSRSAFGGFVSFHLTFAPVTCKVYHWSYFEDSWEVLNVTEL